MKNSIQPYSWHGLTGRELFVSNQPPTRPLIVLFYGQHANLERLTPLAETIAETADVVMPDLPGFGGMDSFYKIGLEAGIDNLSRYIADYLEAKVASGRPVSVVCVSYSFPALTKALSDNPKLAEQIKIIVSFVGFTNKSDFHFENQNWLRVTKILSKNARTWLGSKVWGLIINRLSVTFFYNLIRNFHPKLKGLSSAERKKAIAMEATLWHDCDHRTHAQSAYEMIMEMDLSDCKVAKKIYHLYTENDHFFDSKKTITNMKQIYKEVDAQPLNLKNHSPTFLDNKAEIRQLIPKNILDKIKSTK